MIDHGSKAPASRSGPDGRAGPGAALVSGAVFSDSLPQLRRHGKKYCHRADFFDLVCRVPVLRKAERPSPAPHPGAGAGGAHGRPVQSVRGLRQVCAVRIFEGPDRLLHGAAADSLHRGPGPWPAGRVRAGGLFRRRGAGERGPAVHPVDQHAGAGAPQPVHAGLYPFDRGGGGDAYDLPLHEPQCIRGDRGDRRFAEPGSGCFRRGEEGAHSASGVPLRQRPLFCAGLQHRRMPDHRIGIPGHPGAGASGAPDRTAPADAGDLRADGPGRLSDLPHLADRVERCAADAPAVSGGGRGGFVPAGPAGTAACRPAG